MADVTKTITLKVEVEQSPANAAANTKKQIDAIGDSATKAGKQAKAASGEMAAGFKSLEAQAGALPGPIGNVANALGGVRQGVTAFAKGLGTLRGAIIATGIGALAVVLGSLAAYFSESEKGAQKLRVATAFLKGIMEAFVNVLEKVGGTLVKLWEEPKAVIKDFANSIKTYILDNFNLILSGVGSLGSAMVKVFKGDFAGAVDAAIKGVKELGEGVLKLNPMTGSLIAQGGLMADLGSEAINTANSFTALEKKLNSIKVAERELTVERARSNKTIAEARLIADDVNRSTEERIAAVRRAGKVEAEVAAQEQKIAADRLAYINGKIAADGKGEELLNDRAAAEARIFELERENIMRRKRLQTEEIALLGEAAAAKKEIDDAEVARLKAIDEAAAAKKKNDAAAKKAIDEAEAERLKALDEAQAAKKAIDDAEAERLKAERDERLKNELIQLADLKVAAIADEQTREEAAATLAFERKTALIIDEGEVEKALRTALEDELGTTLTGIRKKYSDIALAKAKETAAKEIATAQTVAAAKMNAAQATGSAVIGIGKVVSAAMSDNAETAKAIATAEVWINAAVATASAISKAVQSSITPYDMIANIAVAVGTVAAAIASTITILDGAVIPNGNGSGSVGSTPSFTSTAPSAQPVSTNVTGLVNTQQAELQPIQAFVVETQMTGSQGNVAQIYSQATFGLGG